MTDTNQDPNYQDILTKYADSLKSTDLPPNPDSKSETNSNLSDAPTPQEQLESTPSPTPSVTDVSPPPTVLEPDPLAQVTPDTEPQTAVMTEATLDTVVEQAPTEFSSSPEVNEFNSQTIPPISEHPEAVSIPQPELQVPPSMQDASDYSNNNSSTDLPPAFSSSDSFVPPPPHPINIAPDIEKPKENHFFKYLFFFSLIIFIGVAVMLALSFYKTQKSTTDNKNTPTNIPPTGLPLSKCEINGEQYDIGQSFPASDGCNTCSCDKDLLIACTTMACDASNSAVPTDDVTKALKPTASATSEATIVP